MDVTFRTRKLEREYKDSKKAIQEYGQAVATRYIGRINIIKSAMSSLTLESADAGSSSPHRGSEAP